MEKRSFPKISIKVLAYNRSESLKRTLLSLANLRTGQPLDLDIYLDYKTDQTAVLNVINAFVWPHGSKEVHRRIANVGILGQWLEAWNPLTDDEYALIIEDDVEVSPFAIEYLIQCLKADLPRNVFGITLQLPKTVLGQDENGSYKRIYNVPNGPFLFPRIGTWGQLLFPDPWRQFLEFFHKNYDSGSFHIDLNIAGLLTSEWVHKRQVWTPYITRFLLMRGYTNLHCSFAGEALAISHQEQGSNFKKALGPNSPLLKERKDLDLSQISSYDYCMRPISRKAISSFESWSQFLSSKQHAVIIKDCLSAESRILKNLIFHLENRNIDFLLDAPLGRDYSTLPIRDLLVHAFNYPGKTITIVSGNFTGNWIEQFPFRNADLAYCDELFSFSVNNKVKIHLEDLFASIDIFGFEYPSFPFLSVKHLKNLPLLPFIVDSCLDRKAYYCKT